MSKYHHLVTGDSSLQQKKELNPNELTLTITGKYLSQSNLSGLFLFAEDELPKTNELAVNSLSTPKLLQYYLDAEKNWD